MMKHKDGFQFRSQALSVVLKRAFLKSMLYSACLILGQLGIARGYAQEGPCIGAAQAEADAVFNQALSTISTLADAAVDQYKKGVWRPDGNFRKRFFGQAGKSLLTIRNLLRDSSATSTQCVNLTSTACVTNKVPRTELLAAFDQIFSVSLPKGLRRLRRLQRTEREKFAQTVAALPDNYITCG